MQLIKNIFNTSDDIGSLLIRLVIGAIIIAHGVQKLFGWWGGYGLNATGQWLASEGFTPGYLMALLAGSAEFFGGIKVYILNFKAN